MVTIHVEDYMNVDNTLEGVMELYLFFFGITIQPIPESLFRQYLNILLLQALVLTNPSLLFLFISTTVPK